MLKDEPQRQSDLAYQKLRSEIIACRLTPGLEVSEATLASRYGFGKAAVRAALTRLGQEDLVEPIARRGYRIMPVTLKHILALFELRMILEPATARLAAGKVSEERLVEADARWSQAYGSGVVPCEDAHILANKKFHLVVAEATGNRHLVKALERVLDETDRLIYLGLPIARELSEIQDGHKPLINALLHGSPSQAEQAAREHVEVAKAIVVDAVVASDSVLEAEIVAD